MKFILYFISDFSWLLLIYPVFPISHILCYIPKWEHSKSEITLLRFNPDVRRVYLNMEIVCCKRKTYFATNRQS
jgi:hypothetical protein